MNRAQVTCERMPDLTLLLALQPVGDAPQRDGEVPWRRLPAAERQHWRCCRVGETGVLFCFPEASAHSKMPFQQDQPLHMCWCISKAAGGECRTHAISARSHVRWTDCRAGALNCSRLGSYRVACLWGHPPGPPRRLPRYSCASTRSLAQPVFVAWIMTYMSAFGVRQEAQICLWATIP